MTPTDSMSTRSALPTDFLSTEPALPTLTTSAPDLRAAPHETSRLDASPLRVLVVDDDADAARSLCLLLQTLGCTTATSHDGPEGLALAGRFEPELAIIDLEMPGMRGPEVVQHLRLQDTPSLALAICVTGQPAAAARSLCETAGFDAFMTKPVRYDALVDLLARADDARRGAAPPPRA